MSDLMLLGVLRMPLGDDPDPLAVWQLAQRAREAADTIEALTAENARLQETLSGALGMATNLTMERDRLREELERWKETWLGWNAKRAALEVDAERWRMFLATRPQNTHAVIKDAIDAARKPGC